MELEIKRLGREIIHLGKEVRASLNPDEKIEFKRRKSTLEKLRTEKRFSLFDDQDRIDAECERQFQELQENQPELIVTSKRLIDICWKIV